MIASFYAALLGLLFVFLSAYVIKGRFKYGVAIGDGGSQPMLQRIRMHANFAEYVPLALLLLFMVDSYRYSPALVHILGLTLVIARILHAYGLNASSGTSKGRVIGAALTLVVIAVCALLVVWRFTLMMLTTAL